MNAHQYGEAISKYTIALSLHPTTPQNIFVKRSEAHLSEGLWEDALNDANEVTYFSLFEFSHTNGRCSGNQA